MRASWLCQHGRHRWLFVRMTDVRRIDLPNGPGGTICTLTERCSRCGLTNTTTGAAYPKRVRTDGRRR